MFSFSKFGFSKQARKKTEGFRRRVNDDTGNLHLQSDLHLQSERSGMEIDAAVPEVMALAENEYGNPARKTGQDLRYLSIQVVGEGRMVCW